MDTLLFFLLGVLLAMQSVSNRWPRLIMTIIVIVYSAVLIIDYQYDIYIGKIEQDEIALFIQEQHHVLEKNWLIDATENYLHTQKTDIPFKGSFYQYLLSQNQQDLSQLD